MRKQNIKVGGGGGRGWREEGGEGVGGGGGLQGVIMCTNSLTHLLSDDSLSDKCWKTNQTTY